MIKIILFVLIMCFVAQYRPQANDVLLKNISLVNQCVEGGYSQIEFDIEWNNSWRYDYNSGINNWDAAWVFVKFRSGVTNLLLSGVNSSGNTLNVSSTEGLRVGMPVVKTGGSGMLSSNTIITSINSATSITVSSAPSVALHEAELLALRIWEHAYLDFDGHESGTWLGDGEFAAHIEPGLLHPNNAFEVNGNPAVGVFIYRSGPGFGQFYSSGVRLRWNYGSQGLPDNAIVDLKVFAIEMVYVPQGSFFIGAGGEEVSTFYTYPDVNQPYKVTSDGSILIGTSPGLLYYELSSHAGDQSGPLPDAFPKGYSAFYCMKYSVTQQQYVDFLNTLTRRQQLSRFSGSSAGHYMFDGFVPGSTIPRSRNGVRMMSNPSAPFPRVFGCDLNANYISGEADDGKYIAMNVVSFNDAAAFADWAGLRPMTELEFEKAARGVVFPMPDAYSWGTDQIVGTLSDEDGYLLINDGEKSESLLYNDEVGTLEGNSIWRGTAQNFFSVTPFSGPARVGIFSNIESNRVQAGASFWGIMDLSSNLNEVVVSAGNSLGRAFAGDHGDGFISATGNANVNSWPVGSSGSGMRGGSYSQVTDFARVSDRRIALFLPAFRTNNTGFRLVRSRSCATPTSMPPPINGNSEPEPGSLQTYHLSGNNNYLWLLPDGYEIVSGQGTNTIEVLTGDQSGEIRVATINACGAGPERVFSLIIR